MLEYSSMDVTKQSRRTATIIFSILLSVVGLTYLIMLFIRGYRINPQEHNLGLLPTGLLVANSEPKGASVYINDKLATATNDTINLSPGDYNVKIEKDGFLPWGKKLEIKKEIVTTTNTSLFKANPNLKTLTNTGVIKPVLSLDKTKIVYAVTQAKTATKNGIWVLDLASTLALTRANTKQLTDKVNGIDWEKAEFIWSPDSKEVILLEENSKLDKILYAYLIPTTEFTPKSQLNDIGFKLNLILEEWELEKRNDLELRLKNLPKELVKIAIESAQDISFSPDLEKFYYTATASATIPDNLIPHPPARSTQKETREITPNNVYVYDIKQDINFLINKKENLISLHWLGSNHLIYASDSSVRVVEYDNTNNRTVYTGPFDNGFVFPSPNTRSLITLSSFRSDDISNLYEVEIR